MSKKLFIVSGYFNQENKMLFTAVFDSYINARRYIRDISIYSAEIDKKHPVFSKTLLKKAIEKEITGEIAFPIIDFKWIGKNSVIKTYRISILFLN